MANDFSKWKEAMKAWLKELIKWQEAHPDKDWMWEINNVSTESDDDGGDRPPTPPKNP